MTGWPVHAIAPDIRVRVVRPMPVLPPALEAEVERLWQESCARAPGLFNGRIFSADVITPGLICGHWSEYRRAAAQMARPELHARLGVRPLAVGGVLAGPGFVVFGRRPADALYQPGEWQLPPAGSVDPSAARDEGTVDVLAALLTELTEEVGLPAEAVTAARPLCLVEHAVDGVGSHVLDFGVLLQTGWSEAAIRERHAAHANGEYPTLHMVPHAGLAGFLDDRRGAMNGQARIFLQHAGLLEA